MRSILFAAAALALGACAASARSAAGAHPVAGCYAVHAGEWMADTVAAGRIPAMIRHRDDRSFAVPATLELTTEPQREAVGVFAPTFRVRTNGQEPGFPPVAWWAHRDQPRVEIVWAESLWHGYRMDLLVRGDTLVGELEAFNDVVTGIEPTRTVVAVRVRCSAIPR